MDLHRAVSILQSVVNGIAPHTRNRIPTDCPSQHPDTIHAINAILAQINKAAISPRNGRAWTSSEDIFLRKAFEKGVRIAEIAKRHLRTEGAIRSRLVKLGLIEKPGSGESKVNYTQQNPQLESHRSGHDYGKNDALPSVCRGIQVVETPVPQLSLGVRKVIYTAVQDGADAGEYECTYWNIDNDTWQQLYNLLLEDQPVRTNQEKLWLAYAKALIGADFDNNLYDLSVGNRDPKDVGEERFIEVLEGHDSPATFDESLKCARVLGMRDTQWPFRDRDWCKDNVNETSDYMNSEGYSNDEWDDFASINYTNHEKEYREAMEDWSQCFDDLSPAYWEQYLGGPDDDL